MQTAPASRTARTSRAKASQGRPHIGIRDLKAKASAIVEDVQRRRVAYAVTKHGRVCALLVPADAGDRLHERPHADSAWDTWQELVCRLSREKGRRIQSAMDELKAMRR